MFYNNSCNQCEEDMFTLEGKFMLDGLEISQCICNNPECPSYGIVQISKEDMLNLTK